jgi:hypothetical protein
MKHEAQLLTLARFDDRWAPAFAGVTGLSHLHSHLRRGDGKKITGSWRTPG